MLDNRLKTFLHLCKTMNYTRTGEELHMTQPAVTQHIQYLEEYYNNKLFDYSNRRLELTEAGKMLYSYTIELRASSEKFEEEIRRYKDVSRELRFGATLTIGEYIMPRLLIKARRDFPDLKISMRVFNTERLLDELESANIDFALVEGHFNKKNYENFLFSDEEFIGIGAGKRYSTGSLSLEDLYSEELILRERGSGTRKILEQILYEKNLSLDNFKKITEIGNMNAIKEMVGSGSGVSFLYEKAVRKELDGGSIRKLNIRDFDISREFNFIFLKNSLSYDEYFYWYKYFLNSFKELF